MGVVASDSFTRADAANLGANWTEGGETYSIASNACVPDDPTGIHTGDSWAGWNTVAWANDQYAQAAITVSGSGGGGQGNGVAVRVSTSGAQTFYRVVIDHAATNNVEVAKVVSGGYTQIGQRTTAFSNGDTLYLEAQGTTLIVKLNGSALGASFTDASIASGRAGIAFSSNETSASMVNWVGGDFIITAAVPQSATSLPFPHPPFRTA
jgi:hypothetical protein